jgi:hypothetical protein
MTPTPPKSPEDRLLDAAFAALEPDVARTARLEERIWADHTLDQQSLAAEWLELFRVGPVLHAGYAVAAAAGLALVLPLGPLLLTALLL